MINKTKIHESSKNNFIWKRSIQKPKIIMKNLNAKYFNTYFATATNLSQAC